MKTSMSVAEATYNYNEIAKFVTDKLLDYGCHRPIYIARIDDSLLGLDTTETEDWQIACVFQPDYTDYIFNAFENNYIGHFQYMSKYDESVKTKMYGRNIAFYSLPFFLAELGDTSVEACNILFSYSNKQSVFYDAGFGKIYAERNSLVDQSKYMHFCNKHAISLYDELLGDKIKQLKFVKLILKTLGEDKGNPDQLYQHVEKMVAELENQPAYNEYWKKDEIPVGKPSEDTSPVINIFGKKHMFNTKTKTIYARMVQLHNKMMNSIQISNMRDYVVPVVNLYNCLDLIRHGEYTYPLSPDKIEFLNLIKHKATHWYNIRKAMEDLMEAVEEEKYRIVYDWDKAMAKELLREFYNI